MEIQEIKNINNDRQVFFDGYWIDAYENVKRVMHEPIRKEPVITKDYPWEKGYVGGITTAYDGEKYRMWYTCDEASKLGVPKLPRFRFKAYAESKDGINWTKQFLNLEDYEGSKNNNLLNKQDHFVVNIDKNPDAKNDEIFKAFKVQRRGKDSAIFAMASPDGIRWKQMYEDPILTGGPFDTKNLFFWDKWTKQYRGYTRGSIGSGSEGKRKHDISIWKTAYRWIRISSSKDFKTWGPLVNINTGDTPFEDLYTNEAWPYERSPGTYLIFPSRFIPDRVPDPNWFDGSGVSDIVFMSSRDGVNFDRSFMEAFIKPGLDKNNWHERAIYFQHGVYQTSPDELSMYVSEGGKTSQSCIRRYTIRPDGFVSIKAGYSVGEFTTKTFIFSGDCLEVNYSTSAIGSLKVEIQDGNGNRIPGYVLNDCTEKFGDSIGSRVTWKDRKTVSILKDKPVKLRFVLKDADLYAFKFNHEK